MAKFTPSKQHIEVAKGTISLGMTIAGIIAGLCVGGGIVAIIFNSASPTEATLFGQSISTGSVGVAFVFVGLVVLGFVIRLAYATLVRLGEINDPK